MLQKMVLTIKTTKLLSMEQVGPVGAERFCKAFERIHKKLVRAFYSVQITFALC